MYLLEYDKLWQTYSDEDSDVTSVTSNKTNDMSNNDFNGNPTQVPTSSLNSNIVEEKQSLQEPSTIPSEECIMFKMYMMLIVKIVC